MAGNPATKQMLIVKFHAASLVCCCRSIGCLVRINLINLFKLIKHSRSRRLTLVRVNVNTVLSEQINIIVFSIDLETPS